MTPAALERIAEQAVGADDPDAVITEALARVHEDTTFSADNRAFRELYCRVERRWAAKGGVECGRGPNASDRKRHEARRMLGSEGRPETDDAWRRVLWSAKDAGYSHGDIAWVYSMSTSGVSPISRRLGFRYSGGYGRPMTRGPCLACGDVHEADALDAEHRCGDCAPEQARAA